LKKSKIYFASDFHLGIPDYQSSLIREKKLVRWLEMVSADADEIFLMGDIFDFWFEYSYVVPKGYVRLLGKMAEITDKGIPVHVFRGNHDIWAFNYLTKELNVSLYRNPIIREFDGKKFFLAHGDGLGPGDTGYKILKKIFEFKPNQFLFRWLHPDIGSWMGLYFSRQSRLANVAKFKKEEKEENHVELKDEMLLHYAKRKAQELPEIDYFIFGHRHIPIIEKVSKNAEVVILGDWISYFTYGVFEDGKMSLKYFEK
jgi:UDP-2,3-diacylglucosamine hydrolase